MFLSINMNLSFVEVFALRHEHAVVKVNVLHQSRVDRVPGLRKKHHLLAEVASLVLGRQERVGHRDLVYGIHSVAVDPVGAELYPVTHVRFCEKIWITQYYWESGIII